MKKSLSEKMFEQMERMRKMVFPPILEHALKQAEFEQKIQPKEQNISCNISIEDLNEHTSSDEMLCSIDERLEKIQKSKIGLWGIIVALVIGIATIYATYYFSPQNNVNNNNSINIEQNNIHAGNPQINEQSHHKSNQ